MTRRGYVDWLRGVGVLIMIEGHTLDSWTRVADRQQPAYGWAMLVAGFGAPIFLFLAGAALALAAGARLRRGRTDAETAARARRRGWQIVGLAFLFRLQSWLISGGSPAMTLLKVDILNIIGVSMIVAAVLWGWGWSRWSRTLLLGALAVATAMLTPLVRDAQWLSALPDPVEWYFRPIPGRTTFTLFPWAGFLLAGVAVGLWIDAAQTDRQERALNLALAIIGPSIALGGYLTSFLPPMYAHANFWTSSPTFFFLRLGILIALVPAAYGWNLLWRGRSPLREFGVSTLFVYWIHVEMVYGIPSIAIHKQLTLEQALLAFAALTLFLFGLVKLKEWILAERLGPEARSHAEA